MQYIERDIYGEKVLTLNQLWKDHHYFKTQVILHMSIYLLMSGKEHIFQNVIPS